MREHTDRGFTEIRQEMQKSTRWLVGLMLANSGAIAVLLAKAGGWY